MRTLIIDAIQAIIAVVSILMLLGYTGSYELNTIATGDYFVRAIICLVVLIIDVMIAKLRKGE